MQSFPKTSRILLAPIQLKGHKFTEEFTKVNNRNKRRWICNYIQVKLKETE